MRHASSWATLVATGALLALAACGNEPSPTSGAGGAGTTSGGGMGGDMTMTATGSGGSAPNLINGCNPATAEDHRGQAALTIFFGVGIGNGFEYTPRCVIVSPGMKILFQGKFETHALVPGEIKAGQKIEDPDSPIKKTNNQTNPGAMAATFTFPDVGAYPYYCDFHGNGPDEMYGVVFVAEGKP